ncbi:MAG TPA: Flp pilus assembly protein CpaB [Paracoccaceae bacterium]|nr:Flp pilus assembly protein CpaB [Paracoccaceae bacterium]
MRMVFGLVLILGLALAGGAVFLVQDYVGKAQTELVRERAAREKLGPLVEVFVVKKTMEYGAPLTKEDVAIVLLPKKSLPASVFTDEAALFPGSYEKPRYVVRQMEKLEPVLAQKVTEPGEDVGLTARLEKGMRAFAIKVDVASGVSGFLQPGDRVDVYWTGAVGSISGEMTRLIEGSVNIVAVDQLANSERSTDTLIARTVTVAVTPQQVARLAQAQATGRLALSLVGTGDVADVEVVEVDSNSLLGIVEQPVEQTVQVDAPKVCTIRTRRGGEMVETPIACTN